MSASTKLWEPSPARAQRSQMHDFLTRMARQFGFAATWEELRSWSLAQREQFWPAFLAYAQIELSRPAQAIFRGQGMFDGRWFEGATLNYARHLLRFDDDEDALLAETELGRQTRLSHRALRAEVARCAAALAAAGVTSGTRVGGFLPNIPETIIAMLAAASLGAIWSSCSPDFGVNGVLDRFGQIEPTVLIATDGYSYGGKPIDTLERVGEMAARLPTLERIVVVPFLSASADAAWEARVARAVGAKATTWRAFLGPAGRPAPPLTYVEVPFNHPLFIMYSSGTTGVPKCIVHGHGGTLLQHMKELMLHCDLRAGERIFYFTTCGWMMWNWLVSGLGTGAALVLYEGNPAHPHVGRLWELAQQTNINAFGTSPKFLAACQKADIHPGRDYDLAALRCLLSTGSPLTPEQFHWVYQRVKADLQLSSISGGTDIISCFMLGNPLLAVYAGEIQCCGLGMDVQAWDPAGRPVLGQKGELVCAAPFPSQPVGFWNDPEGRKYRSAYFEFDWQAPNWAAAPAGAVWRHGDFIEITPTGGIIVYGRSDATLNPGGVRIGTAEIYRIVESIPEIVDSIVVGHDTPDADVEIVLFVVLRVGLALDAALEKRIRTAIAAGATKRHVPRYIRQVSAVPYTISGKKVELAVQQTLRGETVRNKDALANPAVLDEYRGAL